MDPLYCPPFDKLLFNSFGGFPLTNPERTKQIEQILRAKVNIFFKSENLKMLLIKNDGHIGFT